MDFEHMFSSATDSAAPLYSGHMWGGSPFFFGSMMFFAWVTWVLVTIALILGIVWLWKQIQKK